jgi:hypothetical protein
MPIINGIQFQEDAGANKSPHRQYAYDGSRRTVGLMTRNMGDAQVDNAAKALLGYAYVQSAKAPGGINARSITRVLPWGYPAAIDPNLNPTGNPFLWATSIPECAPDGIAISLDANNRPVWALWRWQVQLNTLPFNVFPDSTMVFGNTSFLPGLPDEGTALASGWPNTRYISRFISASPTMYKLPFNFGRWAPLTIGDISFPSAVLAQGVPIPQFRCKVEYVWHNVPYAGIPFNAIANCGNKVNNGPFDFATTGSLYLVSAGMRPIQGIFGDRLFEVRYEMGYLPTPPVFGTSYGWNAWPRIVLDQNPPIQWWPMSQDAAGTYPFFSLADFTSLFRPDQPL